MNRTLQILIAILLVSLGILSRTALELGHNFEVVTAIAVLSGYFFKNKYSFLPVLAILVISDLIIGNSNIFLFTWSGFLFAHLIGKYANRFKKNGLVLTTGAAIFSVVIFFLWTNFGVVALSNMYPHTLVGLMQSYINALPFVRPQLVSATVFTPILYLVIYFISNIHLKTIASDQQNSKTTN